MLEFSKHNININIKNFKDFITISFAIIDDIYQEITPDSIKNRKDLTDYMFTFANIDN